MNGKIKEIKYCPAKREPFVNMDSTLIEYKGISSDFHYGDEVPLSVYFDMGGTEYPDGFCTGKFFPNIVVDQIDDKSFRIKPDQIIQIGQVRLSVSKIKKCFSDCPVESKQECLYNGACVFAKVLDEGEIKVGDSISLQ